MTIKDWLKLNPNHKATLTDASGDQVRVILHGGDGIDQRLVGAGDEVETAIASALRARAMLVEKLTVAARA